MDWDLGHEGRSEETEILVLTKWSRVVDHWEDRQIETIPDTGWWTG